MKLFVCFTQKWSNKDQVAKSEDHQRNINTKNL